MTEYAAATECSCGQPVTKVEVRVVQRCRRGHFVSSQIAPAVLATAPMSEPQTPGQQRAFNGKAGQLDRLRGVAAGTTKAETLARHGVSSSTAFDAARMSAVLDELEDEIARVGALDRAMS
jgi:hypothetical protein